MPKPLKLDAIPDSARWAIANALRSAADKWSQWADELVNAEVADQFRKQAVEALDYAEQFENC